MLVLSLFIERYCFITTVYKTKFFNYVLILILVACDCLFNLIKMKYTQHAMKKESIRNGALFLDNGLREHEIFNV